MRIINYIFISYLDNKRNYELASQINNCYQNKSIQYIATKGYDQGDMHSVIIDKEYSQLQNYDRIDYSLVIAPVVADLCTTPVALSAPPNSYQNNSQS